MQLSRIVDVCVLMKRMLDAYFAAYLHVLSMVGRWLKVLNKAHESVAQSCIFTIFFLLCKRSIAVSLLNGVHVYYLATIIKKVLEVSCPQLP